MEKTQTFWPCAGSGPGRGLAIALGLQILVWTLVPTIVNRNLPLDVVEAIAWGNAWEWGYDKHPPLSAWLAEIAGLLSGGQDWGLYLLSQVCIGLAMAGVWVLCRQLMDAKRALLAVLLMMGVTYHGFTSPEFNVNVAQLPCWAWAFALFAMALKQNKLWQWALIGLCVGLGILSKYLAGLIVFPFLLFPIVSKPHRWVFIKPGMYVSMAVTTAVVLPHVLWAFDNDWITLTYGVRRAGGNESASLLDHVLNPLDFIGAQLLAALGMLIIAWSWGIRRPRKGEPGEQGVSDAAAEAPFPGVGAGVFLGVMAFTPVAVFCLLSLVTGFALRSMWGTPLLLLWGAWLVSRFDFVSIRSAKALWLPPVIVTLVFAGIYGVSTQVSLASRDKGKRTNFNGAGFAQALDAIWAEQTQGFFKDSSGATSTSTSGGGGGLPIVIGGPWEGGNANWYGSSRPVAYLYGNPDRARWVTDADVQKHGALIVWTKATRADADPETFEACPVENPVERFGPSAKPLGDLVMPWPTDPQAAGGGMRFGVWFVPPAELGEVQSGQ